jgi:hypothetical protein
MRTMRSCRGWPARPCKHRKGATHGNLQHFMSSTDGGRHCIPRRNAEQGRGVALSLAEDSPRVFSTFGRERRTGCLSGDLAWYTSRWRTYGRLAAGMLI